MINDNLSISLQIQLSQNSIVPKITVLLTLFITLTNVQSLAQQSLDQPLSFELIEDYPINLPKLHYNTLRTEDGLIRYSRPDSTKFESWHLDSEAHWSYVSYQTYNEIGLQDSLKLFRIQNDERVLVDLRTYEYVGFDRPFMINFFDWDELNQDWFKSYFHQYEYDEEGNEILNEQYSLNNELGEWEGVIKYVREFDSRRNLLDQTVYRWNQEFKVWNRSTRFQWNYNESNLVTSYINSEWDENNSSWMKNRNRTLQEYDINDNLILIAHTGWNPVLNDWGKNGKAEFSYNELSEKVNQTNYLWDQEEEEYYTYSKTDITYSENNNGNQHLSFQWDRISNEWYLIGEENSEIDTNGNVTLRTTYTWRDRGSTRTPENQYESRYNLNNQRLEYTIYYWNSIDEKWLGNQKFKSNFDDEGYPTQSSDYVWDSIRSDWFLVRDNYFYHSIFFEQLKEVPDQYIEFSEEVNIPIFDYFSLQDDRQLSYEVSTFHGNLSTTIENDTLSFSALANEIATDSVYLTIHTSSTESVSISFQVSIDEVLSTTYEKNPFTVFPTLVESSVYINPVANSSEFSLSVIDLNGRIIFHNNHLSGNQIIDFSRETGGLYLLKLQSQDHDETFKLIKR